MADLKTTNIYGDAYINNKVGIATNAPATRLQIGQLLPTAATEGIQFGDDTGARIYRDSSTVIKVSGGFQSTSYIYAGNYLQTAGNLIYPASQTATQRLEVGNASGNAWIDGLTIAQGGNVTVYNNLTTPTATVSGYITFPNDTTAAGLINTAGTAWLRLDDASGNMHMGNSQSGAGIYCDSNAFYWRTANAATTLMSLSGNGDLGAARYLSGTYVNTSDDTSSATVSYIMAKFGDNYHRSAPAAKVAAFLNNQTMSIAGNAATATALTSMNISQFTNNSGYLTSAVTSAVAGTGISVSGATGAVTITNNGVTSAVAGTGVGVSGATGAVTFSIGQAVGTANSPTFATLQLTRLNFGATGAAPYAAAAGEGTGNGITFGGDEAGVGYRIFTSMENIGGNYSKLTFNWHTGIRIGAYYGYGGTRFYNNSVGTGTEIFSVGNTDNNVRVVNSLIVNGITINQERATNARMYGTTTGAFGLLGVDSAGSFRWQIYGDASSHGFLDSTWGNWDIKKTINGELDLRVSSALVRVLNSGNAAYAYNMNQYVRTTDTCSFAALTVSNTINGSVTGNAGGSSTSCTGNAATATGQQSGVHFTLNTGGAGYGLVGIYDPDKHQGLFAMGSSYTLGAGGTLANFYGVSWSYDYAGRQLNTGYNLQHCMAVANAGVVATVIGLGIWTNGLIRANGAISSAGTITAAAFSGPLTGNVTGNVTGNTSGTAGSISGFNNPTTAATANTIVYRDGSGHIYGAYILGSYFNASAGNSENPTIGQIWTQNTTDNYLRKSTPAHFRSQVTDGSYPSLTGANASGTWSINITGNAGTATSATTATALSSMNISQFTNNSGYLTSVTNISGNAATATLATKASTLSQGGGTGTGMTFNWSGQGGQPTWLWGSNDGSNIYVWNPSNFNVNYATSAGSATSAGTATSAGSATTAGSCSGNAATATNVAASGITGQTGMWTSATRPGPYRLYRNDDDSAYNVQLTWQAHRTSYWSLRGFLNDGFHAECFVVYSGYADSAGSAGALTTGNTYQVASLGIGVAASNKLHINGDGSNPTIRIDNTAFGSGTSSSRGFFGWLPISINGNTRYIQLYS